ncbi:hypothetical protein EP7_004318 [Isosphaeraceae bacterium EP7]
MWSRHAERLKAKQRNYYAFSQLACVRGVPGTETKRWPKFIPADISKLALFAIADDGTDGHSHSHLSLREFRQAHLEAQEVDDCCEKKVSSEDMVEELFGIALSDEEDEEAAIDSYRVVFWFDN